LYIKKLKIKSHRISFLCCVLAPNFWREQGAGPVTGDSLSPGVILPVLAGWFRAIAVLLPPRSALALSTPLLLSFLAAAIRRKLFLFAEAEFDRFRLCVLKKFKENSGLQSTLTNPSCLQIR
jgi:hypothetical protein